MHNTISRQARAEVLRALRERYQQAPKQEKTKVLDEFVAMAGCHRKHAIRLLTANGSAGPGAVAGGRRTYDEAVREALIVLWEAADRICGKRLKAVLPSLVAALEGHGHLALDAAVRQRLLLASAATIDRLLVDVRNNTSRRKKRKTSTKPSRQVPIRTFADWRSLRRVTWRSTSSLTVAVPLKGSSCGAWRRRTCARDGPKWCLWWPASNRWSPKGWR
jgi:hypothetical protein